MDVLDLDIQLGSVECRLADTDDIRNAQIVENGLHLALCLVPLLLRADVFRAVIGVPLRKAVGSVLIQTQRLEHENGKLQTALEFVLQLVGTAHQMSLGNGKLPHAD